MKPIDQILSEITAAQVIEKNYKGKINYDLYLIMIDTLNKPAQKIFWKNQNQKMLTNFVNTAMTSPVMIRVDISNGYDDWVVNVYTKS